MILYVPHKQIPIAKEIGEKRRGLYVTLLSVCLFNASLRMNDLVGSDRIGLGRKLQPSLDEFNVNVCTAVDLVLKFFNRFLNTRSHVKLNLLHLYYY